MTPTVTRHACMRFADRVHPLPPDKAAAVIVKGLRKYRIPHTWRPMHFPFRSHGFDLLALVKNSAVVTVIYDPHSPAMRPYIRFETHQDLTRLHR